jgi:uncharacterized membrane protein
MRTGRGWRAVTLAGGALLVDTATRGRYRRLLLQRVQEQNEAVAEPVRRAVIINVAPEKLYSFWRDFTNLPRFMHSLKSVTVHGDGLSRWVTQGPLGSEVEWEAKITREVPNELIAWQALPGSQVQNQGQVTFERLPEGRGTRVEAELRYQPPGGKLGVAAAKVTGQDPDKQVRESLRRFKQLMETGDIPTVAGQPTGPRLKAHNGAARERRRDAELDYATA